LCTLNLVADGKKWLHSIKKQKRTSDLKQHRDRHTNIHTESTTKNNRLLVNRMVKVSVLLPKSIGIVIAILF